MVLCFGCRASGSGLRASGLGVRKFRMEGLGFIGAGSRVHKVKGVFRVYGVKFRAQLKKHLC